MKIPVIVSLWRSVSLFVLVVCGVLLQPPSQRVFATPLSPQEASETTQAAPDQAAPASADRTLADSAGNADLDKPADETSAEPNGEPDGDTISADSVVVSKDEAAIRTAIESYVKAFNAADAKALANHFTTDGELVTPTGNTMRGRSELESGFASYFKESPQAKLELVSTRVDQISPGVAIESGIARVIVPEEGPSETVYEAVHVKTDEG